MSNTRNYMMVGLGVVFLVAAVLLGFWAFADDSAAPTVSSSSVEPGSVTESEPVTDATGTESAGTESAGTESTTAAPTTAAPTGAESDGVATEGGEEGAAPAQSAGELPAAYVTDTNEVLSRYVPYVAGTMGYGPEVADIIEPVCQPSSYSDRNGTELPYSCISSYTPEILHFGVFVSEPEADRALEAYLAVKPGVSYVHEQADAENWVVVVGSTESFAALSGMGYGVTAHD